MVTIVNGVPGNGEPLEFRGLSTDTKPLTLQALGFGTQTVPNGSVYVEIDTSSISMFDASTSTWKAW